jgi:hypothetical protein
LEALLSSPRAEAIDAARLLAAGPLRRRWRLAAARLRGRRERYAAVRSLVRSPAAFHDTGIEPLMTFLLAAAMIEPSWTEGEQFTITYDAEACLHVRSGSPVSANAFSPTVRPATIINCPAGHLAAVLSGARTPETEILGAQRPLEFLQAWLQRAQSG